MPVLNRRNAHGGPVPGKDPASLERVKAGDRVRFTADKRNGAFTVLTIGPRK
ncbi:copper-binding protein [Polaromonas aquatica]|uniref:copper-binding protein n=1 Tax=Polaromonas aquatica TaxID=332657 RepID=UPI003D649999